jgi:hypothetical protein
MHSLEQRITAFEKLGRFLSQYKEARADDDLQKLNQYFLKEYHTVVKDAELFNHWFSEDNLHFALEQWSLALTSEQLEAWLIDYDEEYFEAKAEPKTVAIIMAGNIPLVGLHDLISVLISGHKALIKPSSDDAKLIPFILQMLVAVDKGFADYLTITEDRMADFHAVIATGSNNSSRYFDHYFGKYPNIIRKNRSSVAILEGNESDEELKALGEDIFRYFGLGCRNVSKAYVPKDFDIQRLFEAFFPFESVCNNSKYGNNYDYNRAIFLMEHIDFLENGFFIIKEDKSLHAPVSVLNIERYDDHAIVLQELKEHQDDLQCIIGKAAFLDTAVPFGKSQKPNLWDYADNVDTLEFLHSI